MYLYIWKYAPTLLVDVSMVQPIISLIEYIFKHGSFKLKASRTHPPTNVPKPTLTHKKKNSLVLLYNVHCNHSIRCMIQDIWEAICELLLHPHMWLRDISSRLLSLYFSTLTEISRKNHKISLQSYFLMRPSRLFMIAVSLCCQLKTKIGDDAASNFILQNIVFTVCGVHSLMGQLEHGEPQNFWSTLEQHEQGYFLKALKLLDSGKVQSTFLSLTSGGLDKEENGHSKDIRSLLTSNLLKRMGKIALQREAVQVCMPEGCCTKLIDVYLLVSLCLHVITYDILIAACR